MMKEYSSPELMLVELDRDDIIVTSGAIGTETRIVSESNSAVWSFDW